MKKYTEKSWFDWVYFATIFGGMILIVGLIIYFDSTRSATPEAKVTESQLLRYRGIDDVKGNPLIGLKVYVSSRASGSILLGSGHISSSNQLLALISYKANGRLQQINVSQDDEEAFKVHIRPGSARVKFSFENPAKKLYELKPGDPITAPDGVSDYDHGYHLWSVHDLLLKFSNRVDVYINQTTFDATFGGIS